MLKLWKLCILANHLEMQLGKVGDLAKTVSCHECPFKNFGNISDVMERSAMKL